MFKLLTSLTKALVGTVFTTPASIVADFVTLGGTTTHKDTSYTSDAISDVMKNLKNAAKPAERL